MTDRPEPEYRVRHVGRDGLTLTVSNFTADEMAQHLAALNQYELLTTGGLAPGEKYQIERLWERAEVAK